MNISRTKNSSGKSSSPSISAAALAAAPRWLWALFLVALTSPFWSLSHALVEVDDARYAEVPREMAQTGDWATPTLDYFSYVEKPPLPYWLTAASYEMFGVSETTARLPLALLSLAGLLLTAWLGWWLLSPRAGLLAAVALSSGGLYFFLGRYITPDMPVTVFMLACTALILRSLVRPEDSSWAVPGAWLAAGLAFLSKGLIALVFPGGWVVLLFAVAPKWRGGCLRLLSPLGIGLFLAVAAPWFVIMEKRHPGFFHLFFVEQHFQRFLTRQFNRTNPWYFFILLTPAVLLPWTMPALSGLADAARRWRSRPELAALALWAGMIVAFFSTSQSKLITYILPVMPHLSLLAADALERPLARWATTASRWLGWAFLAAALAAAMGVAAGLTRALPIPPAPPLACALAIGALAALGGGLLAFGLGRGWTALALGGWLVGAAAFGVIRLMPDAVSARTLAEAIRAEYRPGDQIWVYNTYLHGLPFYCRAPVDEIVDWTGELYYAFRDPVQARRHGDDSDLRRLPLAGRNVFVVTRRQDVRQLLTIVDGEKVKENRLFGRWALLRL